MLQNTSLQRLKGDKPTTGLPSGRLVTRPRELSMAPKPQYEEKRTATLTNYGKKTIKRP